MVNTGLQVLIEKRLELFVLLVKKTSLFNQVLTIDQKLIVLGEGLIEGSPHRKLLVTEDLSHLGPVHLLLSLLTASIISFVCRLSILRLLRRVLLFVEVFPEVTLLSVLVELLEGRRKELRGQSEQVLIDFFLLTAGVLLSVSIEGTIITCLISSRFLRYGIGVSTVLQFFLLFTLHLLLLLLEACLMFALVLVHHIDKELNISHVLDSERLADRVDLDLKRFLWIGIH